jgi:hypothetical protein
VGHVGHDHHPSDKSKSNFFTVRKFLKIYFLRHPEVGDVGHDHHPSEKCIFNSVKKPVSSSCEVKHMGHDQHTSRKVFFNSAVTFLFHF